MREPTAKVREPQGLAVRAARAVTAWALENWRGHAVAVAVGVFMALVGAFGTDGAPLGPRLFYWLTLMIGGSLVGLAIGPAVSKRPRIGERRVLTWAVVTVLVTAPVTLFVWWFTGLMFGGASFGTLPNFFLATGIVSAGMTALMMLVNTPGAVTHAPPSGAPPRVRFLERLPPKLMGAVLYAVEAEDHYLRLHTSKGADLLLFRLADAIAELDGLEGAQTHRSWWVARDAVKETRRDGARAVLVLTNGVEAPVSRPNVKALKEAGWI